jgi:WD40 repeat protein
VAFGPDNRHLVSGSMDRTAKVWDVRTGQEVCQLTGHLGPIRSVAFCPDGRHLASVSLHAPHANVGPGKVKLWDTKTWRESDLLLKGEGDLLGVTFRSDGRRLATTELLQVVVWDTASGSPVRTLVPKPGFVGTCSAFGPGGLLASSSMDGTLQVWKLSLREEVASCAALLGPPGIGRLLDVWRATTSEPVHVIAAHKGRAMCVAFSPDGAMLASAGLDGTIKLWDARTFKPTALLHGHRGGIHSLAFRQDGQRLASAGSDAVIRVWDTATRHVVCTLHGHTDAIYTVTFSPDGRWIASGGWDRTVKIWDAEPPTSRRRTPVGRDE